MSADVDRRPVDVPEDWTRLEQLAEATADSLSRWVSRAREAEAEVERLRHSLEALSNDQAGSGDLAQELRRLRTENAALSTRMLEARQRVAGLMQRLAALEADR